MKAFNDILKDEMDRAVTERYLNSRAMRGISQMTDDDV